MTALAWLPLVFLFYAHQTFACAVCYGEPNSPESKALTWGILVLLFIVVGVLACFARFFFYLKKRSQLVETRWTRSAGHPG